VGVAPDGTLWAAGRFGKLGRYRGGVWETIGEKEGDVANARWRCVHVGGKGTVFCGSADGLVAAVDKRGLRSVLIPSAIPPGSVGPMAVDPVGRLYVANGAYLLSHESDGLEFAVEKDFGSVLAIGISPGGVVWVIGRWGLYRKETDGWVEVTPDVEPRPPLFRSLAFDSSGHLWAGAESGEVFQYDGELWVRLADRGEIPDGPVERLVVDRRGSVWAQTAFAVHRYDGSGWSKEGIAGLDSTGVVDFTADPRGEPALLTRAQVWRFAEGSGWQLARATGLETAGEHLAIGFGRDGRSYLATEKGIGLVGDDGLHWIGPRDVLRGHGVTSILADGQGYLWVGSRRDGLYRISLESP
jgi:ligand-binding sensor domain-containing protein